MAQWQERWSHNSEGNQSDESSIWTSGSVGLIGDSLLSDTVLSCGHGHIVQSVCIMERTEIMSITLFCVKYIDKRSWKHYEEITPDNIFEVMQQREDNKQSWEICKKLVKQRKKRKKQTQSHKMSTKFTD